MRLSGNSWVFSRDLALVFRISVWPTHFPPRNPQSALIAIVSLLEDFPSMSPRHRSIDGAELMEILSPLSLNTSRTTHTAWAVASPVFVMVAAVSRHVRPQLTGVPGSRVKPTGSGVRVGAAVAVGRGAAWVAGAGVAGCVLSEVTAVVTVRRGAGVTEAVCRSPGV